MKMKMKMKMKMFISIVAAMLSITMFAEDTPLVQAMKTRDKIEEIREAIARRGIECQSFEEMPQAISRISYINEFFNDEYSGPIVISKKFTKKSFQYIDGSFDVQLLDNTTINSELFSQCYGLNSIYCPKVLSLELACFRGCSNLKNVDIPNCTTIGYECFKDCRKLKQIIMPKVDNAINSDAFYGCYDLTDVITKPLKIIPANCFKFCSSLTNVVIDSDSCVFESSCFEMCTSLRYIKCPQSFTLNSACFKESGMTNATEFLQKMTAINNSEIFNGCKNLKHIRSDSLVSLNGYMLFQNSGIESIDFPALKSMYGTVNERYGDTFENCKNLKHVNMPNLEQLAYSGQSTSFVLDIFNSCTALEEIEFPSLKIIGTRTGPSVQNMFWSCTRLRSARFPQLEYLKLYGNAASHSLFSYCYNLEDIQMPALNVLHLAAANDGYSALVHQCNKLKEINLPNLTELFHTGKFASICPSLRHVYMPSLTNIVKIAPNIFSTPAPGTGTKSMAPYFFNQCPMLTDVTLGIKASVLKSMTGFSGLAPDTCVFHCPADAPNDVTIVKRNGTWEIVNNGTYQLADYLEGTGTQYINTGYIHGTNTVVEMTFSLKPQTIPSYQVIFGSRNNSNTSKAYALYTTYESLNQFAYVRNQVVKGSQYELNDETIFKVVCSNNTCKIYNQFDELLQQISTTAVVDQGVGPLALFTLNQSTTVGGFSPLTGNAVKNMKLYRFTLKENGEVVQDLLPGVRSDGIGCLLDATNNWHPLFNCGTGNFNYGSITNSIPTGI